ncbi:MAG: O-antigen ligase family protein [Candidatus Zipacnadales bacterium]
MRRIECRLRGVAAWTLIAGLFVTPLLLGKLNAYLDLWAHIALCMIVLVVSVGAVLGGGFRLCVSWMDGPWVALIIVYAIASLGTVYPRGTLVELMRLGDYLVLYALVRWLLQDLQWLKAGAAAFACGTGVAAVLGLREYMTTAVMGDVSWRTFGPFYNPNILASALLMAIPMWIALFRLSRLPILRLACGWGLLLCWLCFFATGSKGGALALAGALIVGAVLAPDPQRGNVTRRALVGVGVVLLSGLVALLLPPIRVRVAETFERQVNSMMFRYYTWVGTWHMAMERPFLGFGPGSFAAAYPRFAIVGHTSLAHQTYLQVAAETGMLGLLAFVSLIGTQLARSFHTARQLRREARTLCVAAAAGMVGFCLHNAVDYSWHVTATGMAFWTLAGLVGAAHRHGAVSVPQDRRSARSKERVEAKRTLGEWAFPLIAVAVCLMAIIPAAFALCAAHFAQQGDLRRAMRFDPLNETYHQQLASLAHDVARRGREELYGVAFREWEEVWRLRPTFPGTPFNLAQIYIELGHTAQACAAYEEAERLAPTWVKAIVAHAILLEKIGKPDEALELYRQVDELSESPLFLYRGVDLDLDPGFARAWLALADVEPRAQARRRYVRTAKYLRQLLEANRTMEAVWRHSHEWEQRQGPELIDLCEQVARKQLVFDEPGPRLRGALLLVDAGLPQLAEKLFVPVGQGSGAASFRSLIEGWSSYVRGLHLRSQGQFEAAETLIGAAAKSLSVPLADPELVRKLQAGEFGLSQAEMSALRQPVQEAERLRLAEGVPSRAA